MTGGPTNPRAQQHAGRDPRAPDGQRKQARAAVETAIQTGCGTLLALQASLASVEDIPGEHSHAEASLKAAIELVRAAVSELRTSIAADASSPLSFGFVFRPPHGAGDSR